MAVTFAEARRIVEAEVRKDWRPQYGTLITTPEGFENETHWQVRVGAREWLVDRNEQFVWMDAPAYLVEKTTGKVEAIGILPNIKMLTAMTPVTS